MSLPFSKTTGTFLSDSGNRPFRRLKWGHNSNCELSRISDVFTGSTSVLYSLGSVTAEDVPSLAYMVMPVTGVVSYESSPAKVFTVTTSELLLEWLSKCCRSPLCKIHWTKRPRRRILSVSFQGSSYILFALVLHSTARSNSINWKKGRFFTCTGIGVFTEIGASSFSSDSFTLDSSTPSPLLSFLSFSLCRMVGCRILQIRQASRLLHFLTMCHLVDGFTHP